MKVNIHSLDFPLVLDIFARLSYKGMKAFTEAYPHYLQDEYFKILLEHKGNAVVAWQSTGKAFLLDYIPNYLLTALLRRAALDGDEDKILQLLKFKVDPALLVVPLKRALRAGEYRIARLIKEIAPGLSNDTVDTGYNCEELVYAVENGETETVERLINGGASVDSYCHNDHDCTTALTAAATNGNAEIVRLIIEAGADVNGFHVNDEIDQFDTFETNRNESYTLALVEASGYGHKDIVKLLIESGADVNAQNSSHVTPLMNASWGGHVSIVRMLLEAGAKVNVKRNGNGETALIDAASAGHKDVVELLIESGAAVDAKDKYGNTSMSEAQKHGFTEIIEMLTKK